MADSIIQKTANVCGFVPVNLGKIIKEGAISDIPSIHRVTIDGATERKKNDGRNEKYGDNRQFGQMTMFNKIVIVALIVYYIKYKEICI